MASLRSLLTLSALCTVLLPNACELSTDRQVAASTNEPAAVQGSVVRLRLGGHLEGRLEPCGCAGGQIGGLSRRLVMLQLDRGAFDFLLEGGNFVNGGTVLDEYKAETILAVLGDGRMPHDAIALGPKELQISPDLLAFYFDFGVPFVSADLSAKITDENAGLPPFAVKPFVDLEREGKKLRMTGLVGTKPEGDGTGYAFTLLDPAAAWKRAMDGVAEDAFRILFVHDEALVDKAAELQPKPDLIVAATPLHAEPPAQAAEVNGVAVVHPGTRGRLQLDVHLTRTDRGTKVSHYVPRPLDTTARDETVDSLLLAHRNQVAEDDILQLLANQRPTANGAKYMPESGCVVCHQDAVEVWKDSAHSKAWDTLVKAEIGDKYGWPVTEYPDCVACHTAGYGEQTGFVDDKATPELAAVRCQSCHGPASKHMEWLGTKDKSAEHRGFASDGRASCRVCHDYEQSPDFDYPKRWKVIEHK